jgi:hypothetical protein
MTWPTADCIITLSMVALIDITLLSESRWTIGDY